MLKKMLFVTSLFALAVPAGGAMAQNYYGSDRYDGQHARDHEEHGDIHDEVDEAHAEVHQEGFYNRREHKAYHRALGDVHREFHDEHPDTRHDGYRLPSRRGGGYRYQSYGGNQYYGGSSYYGSPGAYSYGPSITYSYGRRW